MCAVILCCTSLFITWALFRNGWDFHGTWARMQTGQISNHCQISRRHSEVTGILLVTISGKTRWTGCENWYFHCWQCLRSWLHVCVQLLSSNFRSNDARDMATVNAICSLSVILICSVVDYVEWLFMSFDVCKFHIYKIYCMCDLDCSKQTWIQDLLDEDQDQDSRICMLQNRHSSQYYICLLVSV